MFVLFLCALLGRLYWCASFIVFSLSGNVMFSMWHVLESHSECCCVLLSVVCVVLLGRLVLRFNFVRHDSRLSWIAPLLSCRCCCMSCL